MAAVTSRYARAFADVVLAHKLDTGKIRQELASVAETLASSQDLRRLWENPSVPTPQKVRLLDAIAQRLSLARETRNFIAVLIQHRRVRQLEQITRQFEVELSQRLGIADAEITSARELDSSQRRALEQQVERMTGKKVEARYLQDSSLLGGAVIRVGSTIYDGSVRGQLEKIREELVRV
ncbi:MAG: ATP synthase F1 subunit delta [Candidatus Korobacteraceae bacterium]